MKALMTLTISIIFVVCVVFDGNCESKKNPGPSSGSSLALSSPVFAAGAAIPKDYTCAGSNHSPALKWDNIPENTQSFAIIVDDPDAPLDTFTHWIIFNLPVNQTSLSEKASPNGVLPAGALEGLNDFGKKGYGGPCPPPGNPHRYFFKIYALDSMLKLQSGATKGVLLQSMKNHILAEAQIIGMFGK
jgi:Raf kinase inhibitor-like YbhB/YbcL family protein